MTDSIYLQPKILLIIPCYNEQDRIEALLKEISLLNRKVDTLVIDDGSRDETQRVASSRSPVARHAVNLGIGGAIQTGLKYAKLHEYDFAIQCDGDGQHVPSEIDKLLREVELSNADLVVGSRFKGIQSFSSTILRRLGIRFISITLHFLYGIQIADVTSGFRLMNKRAISYFSDSYPMDFPEPISIGISRLQGFRITEVPVQMRARTTGKSSISGWKSAAYVIRVTGYLFVIRFLKRKANV